MTTEMRQRVSQAWEKYIQLPDDKRRRFLEQLRSDDTEVAAELETLLRRHQTAGQASMQARPSNLLDEIAQPKAEPTLAQPGTVDYISQDANPAAGQDATTSSPARAGRYLIQEKIAQGGMGAVLRAIDPDIQRTLAVKVMLPKRQYDPDAQRRFLYEARITGQLQHPGIPPIHEFGELDNGCPFFAMKLIEGRTLADLLKERPNPQNELLHFIGILGQICQTIGYAHSCGIIHRDLKPQNIMVGAFGEVQVMDWGLAKQMGNRESGVANQESKPDASRQDQLLEGTQDGVAMGTPAFMAPEQVRGEIADLDERADVFGLGAILCIVLTGEPPFRRSEAFNMARRGELDDAHARLDRCRTDAELAALCKTCLEPRKEDRPRDAGQVAEAVATYERSVQDRLQRAQVERGQAQVQAAEERKRRQIERQRGRWALLAAATIMLFWIHLVGAVTRAAEDQDDYEVSILVVLDSPRGPDAPASPQII